MTVDPWEEGFDGWMPPASRDQLQELARGIADVRGVEQERAQDEIEALKQVLRERAEAAEEYLRQVEQLRRRMELAPAASSLDLDELRAATEAELALARAERERLEERERLVHEVERELAGLRVELTRERQTLEKLRAELEAREPPPGSAAE